MAAATLDDGSSDRRSGWRSMARSCHAARADGGRVALLGHELDGVRARTMSGNAPAPGGAVEPGRGQGRVRAARRPRVWSCARRPSAGACSRRCSARAMCWSLAGARGRPRPRRSARPSPSRRRSSRSTQRFLAAAAGGRRSWSRCSGVLRCRRTASPCRARSASSRAWSSGCSRCCGTSRSGGAASRARASSLPVKLTHETLGRFVGARRPSVTLAMGQLADDGLITRRDDGAWVLPPRSQEVLADWLGVPQEGPVDWSFALRLRREPPDRARARP